MKKRYILSVVALLLGANVFAQSKEYSGEMRIIPLSLQQKGDSVYVKIAFDISGVNVESRRSISLIPALIAPDNSLHLTQVMVKGRENYHVYQRELALMSTREKAEYALEAPYAVLPGFKSNNAQKIEYNVAIKYEPWMANAKLDMYEDLCGCGNPPRRMGTTMLANQIEQPMLTPYLAYAQPVAETVKRREIVGEVFLDFIVNKIDIRPDYMNNPHELKKITDLISEISHDKDITVRAINVIGYASPEGPLANNRWLSENRAKALVNYLVPKFDYPQELYKVVYGEENWEGLKERVEASQMSYRNEVLSILESVPVEINYNTDTSRKKELMNLKGGEPYRYIVKEFCPSLRKAVCKFDFDIKNFDVSQAKEIIKSRPQNLSLSEMYLVANTHKKGSQDFIDLFETAARVYPNDVIANLNAASAALSRRDTALAKQYLNKIKSTPDTPEYYNTKGVLEMLDGNYEKANSYLTKAAGMGLQEAEKNLIEIVQKRGNIPQTK